MIPIEDPIPLGNAIRILHGIEIYPNELITRDRVNFLHVYGLVVNADKAQFSSELYHGNTYVNLLSFLEWTARHEAFKQYATGTRFVYPATLIQELQNNLSKEFLDTAEAFQKNARIGWLNAELSKVECGSDEYLRIRSEIESLTPSRNSTGLISWEQLSITFLTGDNALIQYPGFSGILTSAELGFKNHKSRESKPNVLWGFLLKNTNESGWQMKPYRQEEYPKVRKNISDIRKTLKAYFRLEAEPFYIDAPGSYVPLFTVRNQS
ncbi:MAG: hypothetical protein HQL77_18730 [Magnetococcales bacterium]|nr:hypothetical protein [Magnetococcales bacterium]